jgi:phosphatidylserine/phosphatidylglycerophosphate/cardiolipin synthase-like enzyme
MKFLIGWNSLGYPGPNKWVANNLTELGLQVKWTKSTDFAQAHQKFIIIDNKTTIVQSGNWAKTSFPESGKICNREWNIAMTDVDVTAVYRSVFDYDWGRGKYYSTGDGTGSALSYSESGSSYPRPFSTAGTFSGQMNVTPIFSPDTSLQGILYCINSAQVTLDIQIPYFTSVYDGGQVDQVISAIVAAKNRGVTVRIITEEVKDWENISDICVAHGISIAWQDTTWFASLHNKGIIVDGRLVLVSSINYSDESIAENREAGVIIQNQNIAQWYQAVYDYDWSIADIVPSITTTTGPGIDLASVGIVVIAVVLVVCSGTYLKKK